MMGPTALFLSFHILLTRFFNNSFEGARSPLNGITDMNKVIVLSWVARNPMLINFLPSVHLVSSCSTTFSHRLFIDKFYA